MANDEATPQQWEQIEMWAEMGSVRDRCLLSVMRRVEALEANAQASAEKEAAQ